MNEKNEKQTRTPSPARQTCRVPWCEEEPDEHVPLRVSFIVPESPSPISVMLGLNLCERHMDALELAVHGDDVALTVALDRVREYERPFWMENA